MDQLARVVPLDEVASWPKGQFFVAEATRRNASGKRRELLACDPDIFRTCEIAVGSEAADILYGHLRLPREPIAKEAEYQAIAWAMTERKDAVLVTLDKRAAMLALAELGRGRVAHAFDLWLHLRDGGLITETQFAAICEATRRNDHGLPDIPLRCKR